MVARLYGHMVQGGEVSEFSQSTAARYQLHWGLLGIGTNMGDHLKQEEIVQNLEVNF